MKRRAEHSRCACGQPLLVGLDGDAAAFPARVDPRPLNPVGEVEALTAGRATYVLRLGALDRRNRWNIPGRPPSHQVPVHVAHDCAQPLPDAWLLPALPQPAPAILTPEEIPF